MNGWKMNFLVGWLIFRAYVSFSVFVSWFPEALFSWPKKFHETWACEGKACWWCLSCSCKLVGWVICFTQPTGFILDLHYGLLVTNLICKIPDTQTKLIWSPTMGCLKGLTNQPLLKRIGHQYMSQKSQFLSFSSSFFGLTSTSQGRTVSCDVFSFQVNRISPTLFLDIRVFFLVVGKSPYFFGGCWDKHRHKKHATVYKPKKLPHFHAELLLCFDLHWVLGMLPAIGFENGDGSSVY